MEKFMILRGTAAPLSEPNISTDAIIPSVWAIMPGIDLGAKLFANWRYDEDGAERPGFVLNQAPFRTARILLAGANFGCGSSRETAVWALKAFGIRCVVAPSFGEIFQENMFKNGLLPMELPEEGCEWLVDLVVSDPDRELVVDLEQCKIGPEDMSDIAFLISSSRRHALLEGIDDLGLVRSMTKAIDIFEQNDRMSKPLGLSR